MAMVQIGDFVREGTARTQRMLGKFEVQRLLLIGYLHNSERALAARVDGPDARRSPSEAFGLSARAPYGRTPDPEGRRDRPGALRYGLAPRSTTAPSAAWTIPAISTCRGCAARHMRASPSAMPCGCARA